MNMMTPEDVREHIGHRLRVAFRRLDPVRRVSIFSSKADTNALRRIYVINLDRKLDRWRRVRREIHRFRDRHGHRLTQITRRFSAIDGRHLKTTPTSILDVNFTLAEQLSVHPNPALEINDSTRSIDINMTKQEQAVALSHIEVWRIIANGDVPSALVIEDDVIFAPGFAKGLESAWNHLSQQSEDNDFDLLYLAYRDVGSEKPQRSHKPIRRTKPGIWEASGYILTKKGAQKLLSLLPVRGPVDLWLNMQFPVIRAYTTSKRLIEQRADEPSTNSYSALPVLSQVGAIVREKPHLPSIRRLPAPIVATGPKNSKLTALAKALSMLGYTCINDVETLSTQEIKNLVTGRRTSFNAFVNIQEIDMDVVQSIAKHNRHALFIDTGTTATIAGHLRQRTLHLPPSTSDKWQALATFLSIEYPSFAYPENTDIEPRKIQPVSLDSNYSFIDQQFDKSPWILRDGNVPSGMAIIGTDALTLNTPRLKWSSDTPISEVGVQLRTDTFPSNLAIFHPSNVVHVLGQPLQLVMAAQASPVRDYTAAAIASKERYLYGSFSAILQPTNTRGLITGLFLHRNSPRQEIDIEFLGKDTTKMLVNVYYNPGPEGTKLEYGYRGTPTLIDLGFDASLEPHLYEIEWLPEQITWKVDGYPVYSRYLWGPTPIPDQSLEFNINLWCSRSVEFSGRLDQNMLPSTTHLHSFKITTK